MKFNKYILAAALGITLMLPLGCSKELDKTDVTDISGDALFKTSDDAVKLVNSIYNTFLNVDFMLKSLWYQANFLSQDFKNYGSDTFFERYEVPASFDPLNTFWVRCYAGIARANSAFPVIAQMKASGILTSALADRLTGEAYFLRGVFYYYLATNFGG
ncbi:MAG: RagB/SusD family nutrient uptake outer membrane protein, partial [Janthinobacterium lividum]